MKLGPKLEKPEIYNPVQEGGVNYLKKDSGDLRIISYNILTSRAYAESAESTKQDIQLSWNFRKPLIVSALKQINPDVICLQEVTFEQFKYLQNELKEFEMIGYAERTNSPLSEINEEDMYGEIVPIIYNPKTVKLIDSQVYWLSETPGVVSTANGASRPRILVSAALHDMSNDTVFVVGDTHYDHLGKAVLLSSGALEAQLLKDYALKWNASDIVYTGDRNCFVDDGYPGVEWYENHLQNTQSDDVRDCGNHIGLTTTFFGTYKDRFRTPYDSERGRFKESSIDHIFHRGSKTVKQSMCSAVEFVNNEQGASLLPLFGHIHSPEARQFASDHALIAADLKPSKKNHYHPK